MKVGLLLITHGRLGKVLLGTASGTLGECPLPVEVLEIGRDDDPEIMLQRAQALVEQLDQGAGILVLTDMFGSTPGNIASRLGEPGRVRVTAGLNLPMLIRIFNYASLDLDSLLEKAISGGQAGVMLCNEQLVSEKKP